MANDKFSTSIRETFNTKYLKVFFLDDSEAQKTLDIIRAVNEVKNVTVTVSKSTSHPGDTLTIYPKPMVDIDTLDCIVNKALETYFSGVTVIKTDTLLSR